MKFRLYRDILTKDSTTTWVEAGIYKVIRKFDEKRLLIDLGTNIGNRRQITIVPQNYGVIEESSMSGIHENN